MLGNLLQTLQSLTPTDCESYPLVLRNNDVQIFNLLNNFPQNFHPSQVMDFYNSISGSKAHHFPLCLNYMEYLVSRSSFLEVLPDQDFIVFTGLIQDVSHSLGSVNRNVIADKLCMEFDSRMRNQLTQSQPSFEFWSTVLHFMILNRHINFDFILPTFKQYSLLLSELQMIPEEDYTSSLLVVNDLRKTSPASSEDQQKVLAMITRLLWKQKLIKEVKSDS